MRKEVSKNEALKAYCKGLDVYTIKDGKMRKMPSSYEYSSGAPASELFCRSLPVYGYNGKFYL